MLSRQVPPYWTVVAVKTQVLILEEKLRTNRGREFLWKSQSDVGDGWRFLTVPDGHEAIAGLILAWSDPFGYDPAGKTFDLRVFSFPPHQFSGMQITADVA
jgi:hypothetical protein